MKPENPEVTFLPSHAWKNTVALSVDVEDYFMSPECIPFEEWAGYPSAIHTGMERLLELFKEYNARATFFFVGWLAERYPEIVRWTAEAGHEIASHGWRWIDYQKMGIAEERRHMKLAIAAIKDVCG